MLANRMRLTGIPPDAAGATVTHDEALVPAGETPSGCGTRLRL